jgi:hypothetical protein
VHTGPVGLLWHYGGLDAIQGLSRGSGDGDDEPASSAVVARCGPVDVLVTFSSSNCARDVSRGDAEPTKVVAPSLPWRRRRCGLATVML